MQIQGGHAFLSSVLPGSLAGQRRALAEHAPAAGHGSAAAAKVANMRIAMPPGAGSEQGAMAVKRLHSLGDGARASLAQAPFKAASLAPPTNAADAAGLSGSHESGTTANGSLDDDIAEDQNGPALSATGLNEPQSKQYELHMAGLLAAWGTNDPAYDLDGDGVVGVSDLLALLAAGGTMMSDKKPNSSLGGLLGDWGKNDSPYNSTGSGSVGVGDLLDFLSKGG